MRQKKSYRFLLALVCAFSLAIIIFPLLHIFLNSFMSPKEIINRYTNEITAYNFFDLRNNNLHFVDMSLFPKAFTFSQYLDVFLIKPEYLRLFWNSVVLVVPILIGQIIISPLAAYGFEYSSFRGKEGLYYIYLLIMLLPLQILLVPNFIVFNFLNIKDSILTIILPAIFNPIGVFLSRQQLKSFPKECIDAAEIDGASSFKLYRFIILPNLKSTLSALSILIFANYYNTIDQAIVFIKSPFKRPLSVAFGSVATSNVGMFFATACIYLLPGLLIFLFFQEYLVDNIALSTIK